MQLDETALPVVLAALLAERGALEGTEVADMMLRALSYIVRHGPQSDQDRWEETAGLNTFTLAACIAALVSGADYLPDDARELALDFADFWNSRLEDWTAVRDTPLARQLWHARLLRARRARASDRRSRRARRGPVDQQSGVRSGACRPRLSSESISCSSCASDCAVPMIR